MALARGETEMSKQVDDTAKDPLLDTPEAALDLNCSESFLAKARMTGTGPEFVKLGRAIRYRQSALNAYKAAQTRISTSQYPTLVHWHCCSNLKRA